MSLTKRQLEFVSLACAGLSNKEITSKLFVSESTVDKMLLAIYRRLDFPVTGCRGNGRYLLLMWAIRNGVFDPWKDEQRVA